MEVSHEVTSMVRRWVRASPAARSTLSRPPSAPVFSPRPERLGLGATPHQDTEEAKAKRKLESRIRRKISGKRRHLGADLPVSESDKLSTLNESSGEECSRSAIDHKGRGGVMCAVSGKRRRKRKRKTQQEGEGDGDGKREGLTENKERCLHTLDGVTTRPVLLGGGGGGGTCSGGGGGGTGGRGGGVRKRKRRETKRKQSLTMAASNLTGEASAPDCVSGQHMTGLVTGGKGTLDCEQSHDGHRTDTDQPLTDPGLEASSPPHSSVTPVHKRRALRRRWALPHSTLPFSRKRKMVRHFRVL